MQDFKYWGQEGFYNPPSSTGGMAYWYIFYRWIPKPASGTSEATEDVSLDIKAYYEDLENLGLNLAVIGETVLEDLGLDLELGALTYDDLSLDLSGAYAELEDAQMDLSSVGLILKDMDMDIASAYLETQDVEISGALALHYTNDLKCDLEIVSPLLLDDLGLNLVLRDDSWTEEFTLNLNVIGDIPEYRVIYAMHLESVISEVT